MSASSHVFPLAVAALPDLPLPAWRPRQLSYATASPACKVTNMVPTPRISPAIVHRRIQPAWRTRPGPSALQPLLFRARRAAHDCVEQALALLLARAVRVRDAHRLLLHCLRHVRSGGAGDGGHGARDPRRERAGCDLASWARVARPSQLRIASASIFVTSVTSVSHRHSACLAPTFISQASQTQHEIKLTTLLRVGASGPSARRRSAAVTSLPEPSALGDDTVPSTPAVEEGTPGETPPFRPGLLRGSGTV